MRERKGGLKNSERRGRERETHTQIERERERERERKLMWEIEGGRREPGMDNGIEQNRMHWM